MEIVDIARICHQANKALCESQGDGSQPDWSFAPDWQRNSAVDGVVFHLDNPDAPPSHSHDNWLDEKRRNGWKYGPVKDAEKKEHPCFIPYDQLPSDQKAKDFLFAGICKALAPFTRNDPVKEGL